MNSLRALMIGPVFASDGVSGLKLALLDLAAQLRLKDWKVDLFVNDTDIVQTAVQPLPLLKASFHESLITRFQHFRTLWRVWQVIPLPIRQVISGLLITTPFIREMSHDLEVFEKVLADSAPYDIVLVCADGSPPGLLALATERHARVAIISLSGIADELKARWWAGMRVLASARTKTHPYLYRQVPPEKLKVAIFASRRWRSDAVRRGLPPSAAHTIYFGIPAPTPLPRGPDEECRLLWVARLSPEKGLHLFLRALPRISKEIEAVSLTVVAAQGPAGYRRLIDQLVNDLALGNMVRFRAAVERSELQQYYARHEMLLFHSMEAESVALVMMEAMAAGLPVVASRPQAPSPILQENITCLCYDPRDSSSIVEAVVRLHASRELRESLAGKAKQAICDEFSLDAMGRKYDDLLRDFVNS